MADKTTTYFLEGDTDSLVKAVDAGADALDKLAKDANKTTKAVDKVGKKSDKAAGGVKKLGSMTTKANKALASVKAGAPKVGQALKGLEVAAQGVGGKTGEMAGRLSAFSTAAVELANPVGVAVGAIAVLAAGAVVATVAIAAMAGGMISAVFAADELNEELKEFEGLEGFQPIDPKALAAIETVNASLAAMGVIFDRLTVTLGAEVAPALEKTALVMVKLGLMALDTFTAFAKGEKVLVEFGTYLGGAFVKALARPIKQIASFYDALGMVAIALGQDKLGAAFRKVKTDVDDLAESFARPVVEGVFGAASDAIDLLGGATGDYDKRARKLLGTIGDLGDELGENKDNADDLLKAWEALATQIETGADAIDKIAESNRYWLTEEDKLFDAYNDKIEKLGEIEIQTKKNLGLIDEEITRRKALGLTTEEQTEAQREGALSLMKIDAQRLASIEALSDGLEKLDDTQKDHLATVASTAKAYEDAFGAAINFVLMQNEILTNSQRDMLLVLYRLQQAAAITSIIIDTAEGIMKYAKMGPAGIAGSIAIGALGATQLATVAATPPPFHVGGIIPDGAGLASVLPGESVLTREATAKLGADGVRDLNSGMGSPTLVIEQVYKHKIFDSFVQDNINKGGPLASAIRGTSRVGRA